MEADNRTTTALTRGVNTSEPPETNNSAVTQVNINNPEPEALPAFSPDWAVCLLDDAPKQWGEDDAARLDHVYQQLVLQLTQSIATLTDKATRNERGLCMGLFGGLGQGKSSVIKKLWHEKEQEFRIQKFNTADYRADMLEHELDRIIGSFSLGWKAIKLTFSFIPFLVTIFSPFLPVDMDWGSITHIIIISVGTLLTLGFNRYLLPSSKIWIRDSQRLFLLNRNFFWNPLKSFKSFFRKAPKLFIVDDLDRANIKQQRAILRALLKLGKQQRMVILVVMDETQLRQSAPDPESPEEFLRKVISVELRIPHRVQEDVTHLTLHIATDLRAKNVSHPTLPFLLASPIVVADLCRVISLLPDDSPRHIKRFLNDWALRCSQSKIHHPEDASALLRLLGLYELCPRLRSDNEALIELLRTNRIATLEVYCAKHKIGTKRLLIFYKATRSLRPLQRSWSALIGHDQNGDGKPITSTCSLGVEAIPSYKHIRRIRQALYVIAQGFRDGLEKEEGNIFLTYLHSTYFWSLAETALVHLLKEQRSRVYFALQEELLNRGHIPTDKQSLFAYGLYRRWLSDEAVLSSFDMETRLQLLQNMKTNLPDDNYALGSLFPGQLLPFIEKAAIIGNPGKATSRSQALVRRWLTTIFHDKAVQTEVLNDTTWLRNTWPIVANSKDLAVHFSLLRHLKIKLPPSLTTQLFESPWLTTLMANEPLTALNAFHCLFYNNDDDEKNRGWSLSAWDVDQLGTSEAHSHAFFRQVARHLFSPTWEIAGTRKHELWEALLLLACSDTKGDTLKDFLHNKQPNQLHSVSTLSLFEQLISIKGNSLFNKDNHSRVRVKKLIYNESLSYTSEHKGMLRNALDQAEWLDLYAFIFPEDDDYVIPGSI